MSLNNLRVIL